MDGFPAAGRKVLKKCQARCYGIVLLSRHEEDTKAELEDPEDAVRRHREKERMGPEWRPEVDVDTFVSTVSELLGLDEQDLRSSRRTVELVEGRELLMTLGVERYRLRVKELAENVCKSPDGMSQALARGVRRRAQDADFRNRLGDLDHAVAQAIAIADNNVNA